MTHSIIHQPICSFIVAASANQSTESLPHPSNQPQSHLSPDPAHITLPGPNNLPRVLSNPSLLRESPAPPPPPPSAPPGPPLPPPAPHSLWPPPDLPVFSLANAISLAMSVAHSFMPPLGGPNQAFHPQSQSPALTPPMAALSPPVTPSLGSMLAPSSPTSFSGPFSSRLPLSPPRPQTSPASSKLEASQDWTLDMTQVGQVTSAVKSAATDAFRSRRRNDCV